MSKEAIKMPEEVSSSTVKYCTEKYNDDGAVHNLQLKGVWF